jgi:hypothetical protein
MCVNYRELNRLTMKNQYPLPLIIRLLDQSNHAKVCTKIDLHGTYSLVRIQEGNKWKMLFKTLYGHSEYVVMPFGFITMLSIFQHLMNNVFPKNLMILWFISKTRHTIFFIILISIFISFFL